MKMKCAKGIYHINLIEGQLKFSTIKTIQVKRRMDVLEEVVHTREKCGIGYEMKCFIY